MGRVKIIFLFMAISLPAFCQSVQVLFVSQKGVAQLVSKPEIPLFTGQLLDSSEHIILKEGSQIRLLFLKTSTSKKYKAPIQIHLADEINKIVQTQNEPNHKQRIKDEVQEWIRSHMHPEYTKYAGTREIEHQSGTRIHDYIKSYLPRPHFVLQGTDHPQTLILYRMGSMEKICDFAIPESEDIMIVEMKHRELKLGNTYYWKIDDDAKPGILHLVSAAEAKTIKKTLAELEREAIDQLEFNQMAATYLYEAGYWTEAFTYIGAGFTANPDNPLFRNLQNALKVILPEDQAFEQTLKKNGTLALNYSFRLKRNDVYYEICDGDTIHIGEFMQIRLQARQDCYLFVLNLDSAKKPYVLFPSTNQDHFLKKDQVITLPAEQHYFRADAQTGTELLYIIAATIPMDFFTLELDKYFSAPSCENKFFEHVEALGARGFNQIYDESGNFSQDLIAGNMEYRLNRLLKSQGSLMYKIRLIHVD